MNIHVQKRYRIQGNSEWKVHAITDINGMHTFSIYEIYVTIHAHRNDHSRNCWTIDCDGMKWLQFSASFDGIIVWISVNELCVILHWCNARNPHINYIKNSRGQICLMFMVLEFCNDPRPVVHSCSIHGFQFRVSTINFISGCWINRFFNYTKL